MSDDSKKLAQAEAIVTAALAHVPFDGWSQTALEMGAADCDIPAEALSDYLPNGVDEAISLYAKIADREMVDAFLSLDDAPTKTHLKIRALILLRLEKALAHKQTVSATMSYLAQPQHAAKASHLLYQTVDVMWRTAGDTATDVSFYSKRATLAAVYSATLLAFLSDDGSDMAKTQAFLDRRLADVAKIPKMTGPAKSVLSKASSVAQGVASAIISAKRPF